MEQYKQEFIEFMVESDVLKFGDFTLKSGRKSPFFMNAGAYVTGDQLHRLGLYYARAINDSFGLDFDVVFGPAYKGIPLSVITAMGISELYGKQVRYCSNRKEAKDHGDAGIITAQANIQVKGLMVSLNRQEVGKGGSMSALDEVSQTYGFPTSAIVTMAEVVEHLHNRECMCRAVIDDGCKAAIDAYYKQYGAK